MDAILLFHNLETVHDDINITRHNGQYTAWITNEPDERYHDDTFDQQVDKQYLQSFFAHAKCHEKICDNRCHRCKKPFNGKPSETVCGSFRICCIEEDVVDILCIQEYAEGYRKSDIPDNIQTVHNIATNLLVIPFCPGSSNMGNQSSRKTW